MESLTTTSLPSSPSASVPFLNCVVGGQNLWTRSRSRSRSRSSCRSFIGEPPSKFRLSVVRSLSRPKVPGDHQLANFSFLFPSPSPTDLVAGAFPWKIATCKFSGRRRCCPILMAPSSSSSPIPSGESPEEEDGNNGEVEKALEMDETIPGSSGEFLRWVSSRAYDIRRNLLQTIDSSSYEVLDQNPWREDSKPVFVLTQGDNQLCTMKTRQSRSEVEKELGLLFTRTQRDKKVDSMAMHVKADTKFNMFVEDIREGILVFEDEGEASKYCELLQGGSQKCEGIAELEVSLVFDICQKMKALAVIFRRGRTPPLPTSLERNLRARKRSLDDEDIM